MSVRGIYNYFKIKSYFLIVLTYELLLDYSFNKNIPYRYTIFPGNIFSIINDLLQIIFHKGLPVNRADLQ